MLPIFPKNWFYCGYCSTTVIIILVEKCSQHGADRAQKQMLFIKCENVSAFRQLSGYVITNISRLLNFQATKILLLHLEIDTNQYLTPFHAQIEILGINIDTMSKSKNLGFFDR